MLTIRTLMALFAALPALLVLGTTLLWRSQLQAPLAFLGIGAAALYGLAIPCAFLAIFAPPTNFSIPPPGSRPSWADIFFGTIQPVAMLVVYLGLAAWILRRLGARYGVGTP